MVKHLVLVAHGLVNDVPSWAWYVVLFVFVSFLVYLILLSIDSAKRYERARKHSSKILSRRW